MDRILPLSLIFNKFNGFFQAASDIELSFDRIAPQHIHLKVWCILSPLACEAGKGVLGKRETRGARKEGGRETPARKPLFFPLLTSTRRMLKS